MEHKENTHHNSHTLRYVSRLSKQPNIRRCKSSKNNISEIDTLIHDTRFIENVFSVPFNNSVLWNDVQNQLETSAKSVYKKIDRNGCKQTIYSVPAVQNNQNLKKNDDITYELIS